MSERAYHLIIVLLLVVSGGIYKVGQNHIEEKEKEIYVWQGIYETCSQERKNVTDALDQANSNIHDAKYYAWESYDEMGEALEGLEEVSP